MYAAKDVGYSEKYTKSQDDATCLCLGKQGTKSTESIDKVFLELNILV